MLRRFIRRRSVACFLLYWPLVVSAQQECVSIVDDAQRLQCYDESFARVTDSEIAENVIEAEVVPAENTVFQARQQDERALLNNRFGIMSYRRTYLLPITHLADINEAPYQNLLLQNSDESLQKTEMKFQLSFQVPIGRRFLFADDQLYFTYTQRSLWQAYNRDISSPFRETNYEPELLWSIPLSKRLFNGRLSHVVFGFNHQSNGRSGELSRSWNRLTVDATWADKDWALALRLWHRLPELEEDDDNPDITDYLGYGELRIGYRWDDLRFTGVVRNSFGDNNHTSVDLSFSKPLNEKLRGFIQYVNGYGETLIDYDYRTRRIGFGIVLSDWF